MKAYPFIDLVIRGEAEESLPAVLHELDAKRQPSMIPGVTYRFGGTIMRNEWSADSGSRYPAVPAFHLYPHMEKCSYSTTRVRPGLPVCMHLLFD
jgi:radical SAM superfamily enzyme YgiQ (UPF0313 family)